MSGKKKRSVTGEEDSSMSKVPKSVGVGIVEQHGLESDKFEPIVPRAVFPAMHSRPAGVSESGALGGSAIVTPVKPPKQFYLLNKRNSEIEKAASYADAVGLKSMMVRLSGVEESAFVIKDFLSDSDATSYLKSISSQLLLDVEGESAHKICNALVPVPDMISDTTAQASSNNSSQDLVVVDDGSVPFLPIGVLNLHVLLLVLTIWIQNYKLSELPPLAMEQALISCDGAFQSAGLMSMHSS
jgi:hypothetical protein